MGNEAKVRREKEASGPAPREPTGPAAAPRGARARPPLAHALIIFSIACSARWRNFVVFDSAASLKGKKYMSAPPLSAALCPGCSEASAICFNVASHASRNSLSRPNREDVSAFNSRRELVMKTSPI
jgi:hypothetical protein